MDRSRNACREGAWNPGLRMDREIHHAVKRRDGALQIRRAYFAGQEVEMVEVRWFFRDVGVNFHGKEVRTASLEASFVGQRRYTLNGIGNPHGKVEVGDL